MREKLGGHLIVMLYIVYSKDQIFSLDKATGKGNAIHDVSGINSSTSEEWLD